MRAFDKVRLRLRSLARRTEVDHELDEEFRFHLDQVIEENLAAGMAEDEAPQVRASHNRGDQPASGGMPRYATGELHR